MSVVMDEEIKRGSTPLTRTLLRPRNPKKAASMQRTRRSPAANRPPLLPSGCAGPATSCATGLTNSVLGYAGALWKSTVSAVATTTACHS